MSTIPHVFTGPADTQLTIQNVRDQIIGVDVQVPLLDNTYRMYVNFDNAASTPALRPVVEKVNEFLDWYSSVHRGSGFKSQVSTHVYEEAHRIVCRFLHASPATNVTIFGKNSTEALNKLARRLGLKRRDVVLTTMMEHHSNDLPWRAVAHVEHVQVTPEGALDLAHLDELLRQYAGRVKVVTITGASNVTGYINPVHLIAAKAHAAGAQLVVDAAQLAPHRAIDMRPDNDPGHLDYVVLSAHKMYAPFGTGALVGRSDTFLQGDPDLVGGGTVDIVTVDSVKWAEPPDKEEAGSPNVVGAVALAKAILSLQQIGMPALAEHEARLTARLLSKLARIDKVHLYGLKDPAQAAERVGVIPFNVDKMSHYLLAAILSAEGGIGVRNGCFCAHPYLLHILGVSRRKAAAYQKEIHQGTRVHLPGLARVSFGCYNTEAEIDWFGEVLEKIVRRKYQGQYEQDPASGAYHAVGFSPDLDKYFTLYRDPLTLQ